MNLPSEAAARVASEARSYSRLRVVLALAFCFALLYVGKYVPRYFRMDGTAFAGVTPPYALSRLVHISFGLAVILIGPLQLFSGPRRRNLPIHRVLGRVYVVAVLVGSVAAAAMLTIVDRSLDYRLGLAALTFAWFGTTALAYVAIRRRQLKQHQEWMVRSYVATFAFVVFRVTYEVLTRFDVAPRAQILGLTSWACWSIPLLITEFVLQARKIFAAEATRSRRIEASAVSTPEAVAVPQPTV